MMERAAIGVFDSGIGGLTVARAIARRLPHEDIIYLGDTARLPYGTKSATTVARYAERAVELLARYPIKTVVIACNTATAHALERLRELHAMPILGVIEPGARAALPARLTPVAPVAPIVRRRKGGEAIEEAAAPAVETTRTTVVNVEDVARFFGLDK